MGVDRYAGGQDVQPAPNNALFTGCQLPGITASYLQKPARFSPHTQSFSSTGRQTSKLSIVGSLFVFHRKGETIYTAGMPCWSSCLAWGPANRPESLVFAFMCETSAPTSCCLMYSICTCDTLRLTHRQSFSLTVPSLLVVLLESGGLPQAPVT